MAQDGGPAQQVDANIQAILQQHTQQLLLLQNQMQILQQHLEASENEEKVRRWIDIQRDKFDTCDGSSTRAVREWLRYIHGAARRVPQGIVMDVAVKVLMEATASGELYEEYEVFMQRQANRANVTVAQLSNHLSEAFLDPDEEAVLKEEVRVMRQVEREDIRAYNRRFNKAAALAYPQQPRPAWVEEQLTENYMGSLVDGKVKDRVFDADPMLMITLQAAMTVASL